MDYKELYYFLKNETGKTIDDSSPNLRIEKDLHIYGDEAIEFLEKFSEKFNVKIDDFHFEKYFNNEGDIIGLFIKNMFKKSKKIDLTINDLKEAIKKGRLE